MTLPKKKLHIPKVYHVQSFRLSLSRLSLQPANIIWRLAMGHYLPPPPQAGRYRLNSPEGREQTPISIVYTYINCPQTPYALLLVAANCVLGAHTTSCSTGPKHRSSSLVMLKRARACKQRQPSYRSPRHGKVIFQSGYCRKNTALYRMDPSLKRPP